MHADLGYGFRHLFFGADIVLGMRDTHHPFIEPAHDVIKTFDAMPRLSRTRKLVSLAWKYDHSGWALQKLECAEQLLAARILRSASLLGV